MEYALAAIAGYCGTGWPLRFKFTGGGAGGGGGGDPWPDGCEVCGGLIGAIAGVLTWIALRADVDPDGGAAIVAGVSFLGGSVGHSVVRGLAALAGRGRTIQ